MKNFCEGQVIGIPVGSSNSSPVTAIKQGRSFGFNWINKLRKGSNNRQKMRHGDLLEKFSETSKGNLNLSKKIYQTSKVEGLFKKLFSVDKEERLIKCCKCCLSTTTGPIKGILFVSTKKIAFCSDESIKLSSSKGIIVEVPYKVLIPVEKVKKAIPSESAERPHEKYLRIVTVDNFEFWFMGLFNYQKFSDFLRKDFSENL